MCIRYWMKYIGLPSKQEPWVNCSNLPCKAELFSLYPLSAIASFKGYSAEASLDSQLFPLLLLLVCSSLHLPRFSWGDERCFSFFGNFWLCCCVCGFLRNGCVGFLNSCSGQTQADNAAALELFPLHYQHFPWGRTAIYLMEWHIFSALSVLKYQVSELIGSRWVFLQKKV